MKTILINIKSQKLLQKVILDSKAWNNVVFPLVFKELKNKAILDSRAWVSVVFPLVFKEHKKKALKQTSDQFYSFNNQQAIC